MKKILFLLLTATIVIGSSFPFDIRLNRVLPDYAGDIGIIRSNYHDIETMWVSKDTVALSVEWNLNIIKLDSGKTIHIMTAEDRGQFQNRIAINDTKYECEGIFSAWDFSDNNFLFDTHTGKHYRLNDLADREEILANPEDIYRSFRYSYEGNNFKGFAWDEPFRIYRTDNYTQEKEVIWEAQVKDIFPGINFNARSHIIDISEDRKQFLISVGRGEKGSIFVADFDGTGLSNAREIMYDYVPDAVFVGNEYAAIPYDRMAVGTEGNGLWRLGIYDFEGNRVADVEDVWVGDSINQFDVDEDGGRLVLVGIYKDEVGIYLFDIGE